MGNQIRPGRRLLTGKRRIRYVAFKGTKRAAEIELARLVAQNAAGEGIDPSKSTVAEFLDRWERDWATANVGPKTLERYRQLLRLYVKPQIGAVRIQKLRAVHLAELYSSLLRSGGKGGAALSARSVGHVHRVLHRAIGHAATWGVVAQNVVSLVAPLQFQIERLKSLPRSRSAQSFGTSKADRSLDRFFPPRHRREARGGAGAALERRGLRQEGSRIERALEQTKGSIRIRRQRRRMAGAASQSRRGWPPSSNRIGRARMNVGSPSA